MRPKRFKIKPNCVKNIGGLKKKRQDLFTFKILIIAKALLFKEF